MSNTMPDRTYSVRLAKLRSAMQKQGLDGFLVTHSPNRRYMTGFTGSAGYVLAAPEEALLLTDFRYMDQAAAQAPNYEVVQHASSWVESVAEQVRRLGIRRLGIEARHLTVSMLHMLQAAAATAELAPTEEVIERIRNIKDEVEIRTLEKAVRIAEEAFAETLKLVSPGVKERELAAELEYRMRRLGADCGWHPFIIASGERSALPHGAAGDKAIASGEFVTFDFGAIVDGYMSDITRTVFVGTPTARHREIYNVVLEANKCAIAGLRPGMTGKEGDALGRNVISAYGYGAYFGHGLGHGIGLEIHEQLRLSRESDAVLETGNVLTVEPGIYIPGFGGVRIEDDVAVTRTGVRTMTSFTKELILL